MGAVEGRVAIVTGGGAGLGREHALLLAAEGARVVVNDVGMSRDGSSFLAEYVADEIISAGGAAVVSRVDVSDWVGARSLIDVALNAYGQLDVLVNNAGIMRHGDIAGLDESHWDLMTKVHLRGHVAPLHWATRYWKSELEAGRPPKASVVNTTSLLGLGMQAGPPHYAAAKAAIAQLTINASGQLAKYGVRVNAISPAARTPMTTATVRYRDLLAARVGEFDEFHPGNVSPLVVYLATETSHETGRVYLVHGGYIGLLQPWYVVDSMDKGARWSVSELSASMPNLVRELLAVPGAETGYR